MFDNISLFYHADCMDGSTAAAVLFNDNPNIESCTAVNYGKVTAKDIKNTLQRDKTFHVVFVDFCPSKEVVLKLIKYRTSVLILDHHKTAKTIIDEINDELSNSNGKDLFRYVVANNLSGAGLSYCLTKSLMEIFGLDVVSDHDMHGVKTNVIADFVSPTKLSIDNKTTLQSWVSLANTRDLWLQTEDKEKADLLNEWFTYHRLYKQPPNEILNMIKQVKLHIIVKEARSIRGFNTRILKSNLEHAHIVELKGRTSNNKPLLVVFANSSRPSDLSDLVRKSYPNHDTLLLVMNVNYNQPGLVTVSLRSEGVHALKLAEYFGGGGHPNACGFSCKYASVYGTLESLMVKILNISSGIFTDSESEISYGFNDRVEKVLSYTSR